MIGARRKMFGQMAAAAIAVTFTSAGAVAAPQTYQFSGVLDQAFIFGTSTNSEWAFASGQAFRGQLVYDAAAVTYSYDYLSQPDFLLTFHTSPLVSLTYEIDTPNGTFSYSPPPVRGYAAIGKSDGLGSWWTGADLRWSNYANGGKPDVAVPASGYVGPWYSHSSSISLLDYHSVPLGDTGADVDLVALFNALPAASRQFDARFSDPAKWEHYNEHLDGIIYGKISSFALATSAVPEPTTWAMLVIGFGMMGAATRYRRRATKLVYA